MIAINKYIVIQTIDETEKTKSGLILSGEDKDSHRYKRGVVIKPGTDVPNIKEGDKIYFDKSASFTMLINGDQYTIIREQDVVVVE